MGGSLEHHPFSGQVHLAGELLHPLWDLMSDHSDTLSQLSVHPASPVLLTRSGPLSTRILRQGSMK